METMKKTGIIRRVDDLGRLVLPKDFRKTLNIHEGDTMEIALTENGLSIRKYDCGQQAISYLKSALDELDEDGYISDEILFKVSATLCEVIKELENHYGE